MLHLLNDVKFVKFVKKMLNDKVNDKEFVWDNSCLMISGN